MSMQMRWVGEADYDRVAETRLRCYAPAAKDLSKFKDDLRNDQRAQPGDFLLAEESGQAVGTLTSLSMNMWVRGGRIPSQGVAFVGVIRTARRGGVAKQLMETAVAKAREREQVVTALMPFRASFYERFGYGFAERRTDWTVPLSLMPSVDTTGLRYATPADRPAIAALRQKYVEHGQCDIETTPLAWKQRHASSADGFEIVDGDASELHGYAMITGDTIVQGRATTLRVMHAAWDSMTPLIRLLAFLGGQRDQFATASLTLPGDVPLNQLLRETQLPHRPVSHAFAEAKPYTRMQLRVLDHRRLLESLLVDHACAGAVTIGIQECEGAMSKLKIDISDGRIAAKPFAGDCDVLCPDRIWASVVTGDLPVRTAAAMGLLQCSDLKAIDLLDAFSSGPAPFCNEYF